MSDNDNDEPCRDVDAVLASAIESLLWSETICLGEGAPEREDGIGDGEPFDDHFYAEDLSEEALSELRSDVEGFLSLAEVREVLDRLTDLSDEQIGHDFILTRNRHGAGFWDRGLGADGETLTKWAHTFGTFGLMVGDDGDRKVYHHG